MRVNFATLAMFDFSRREFMKGAVATAGAFVLGAYIPFSNRALAQEGGPAPGIYDPNLFLKIAPDDSVTLISKHLEMGQGVTTGMATMVAEELGADWSKMRFEFAPNHADVYKNLFFGVMATGGSTSTAEAWDQMRQVGAAARMMLVSAAAAKWNVQPTEIKVEKGVLIHASGGRRASFGELAADAMNIPVPKEITLKSPREWQLIGKPVPRLDSKGKTTGTAIFAFDVRRPDTLTAVVKHPERFGAKVASFDATEAKTIAGVVDVVQISNGVAVVATDTWAAIRGRDVVKVSWDTSAAEKRSTPEILEEYRQLARQPGLPAEGRGDAAAALARAAKTLEAEFTFPYLAHAPMEPLNCILQVHDDGAEIWSGCQIQSVDQYVAAQILGFKPEQVKINTSLGGGSFGRRGNPLADWIVEVSEIAKASKQRAPIHLVWTREDDLRGGFYRPMVLHRVKVGIGPQGEISGWQHRVVSQPIFVGTPFERMAVKNGVDSSTVEGIVDSPYAIHDLAVEVHNAKSPVPVLWWRSVGHSHTSYVMESMLDEIAHATGKDPVALRLGLLAKQPREAAVVKLAAEKAGWNRPFPRGQGRGRGFAFHRAQTSTRVAMVSEVAVSGQTIKIERVVAAVDCGTAVNPDVVTAQIEGGIGFALSSVLRNQVTLKNGIVEQLNFDDYEPTRMREMPKVEVYIVSSAEAPSGVGEPAVPPLTPAIGNAIFAATGQWRRSLPFGLKTSA